MFHCADCGIAFPSAALLSNHKQRFCISSRVDLQTQRLLQGDGFAPAPQQQQVQPFARWDAPQPYQRRQLTPPRGGNSSFLPAINQPQYGRRAAGGGGGGGPSSSSNGAQLMMADPGPRSYSAEPYLPGDHNAIRRFPAPMPSQSPLAMGPSNYFMGSELYRVLEQQQQQIQQLTAALSYGLGPVGGYPPQQHPHLLPGMPPIGSGVGGGGMNGNVIEGRYGLRIFAAEGLLAFHTIVDHTPVSIALRQFYCRRRVGQYLPELEQRDEWEFTTRRAVAAKRRDGYVNFGRAEYIFNVVTANEIVLVIELLSKGRLVAWAEVMLDSLGDKVRRLRHPPVDIAGALRDLSLRSTTATIGIELFRARWDMFGYDGRDDTDDEEEEEAPKPKPKPKAPPPPPTPPPAVKEYCRFFVDAVSGVPFNIVVSRVAIHVSTAANDIGDPVCTSIQELTSPSSNPQFRADANCKLTDSSCVVVVIEAIENKKQARVTLGHCVIPVRIGSPVGNFICRVRRGEPNKQQLIPYHDDILDYLPCMQMHYRLDCTELGKTYQSSRMPLTESEKVLEEERRRVPQTIPASQDVPMSDVEKWFRAPVFRGLFDTSFLAPYNQVRGLFIHVEQLKQVNKDVAIAPSLHKVAVTLFGRTQWTRQHDMRADIGTPVFLDEPFMFPGIPHDPFMCAIFTVYKISGGPRVNSQTAPIEPVAWGCAKMFLAPNAVRNGRFMIPLFVGTPSQEFLNELAQAPIEGVMIDWVNRSQNRIEYYNYATLLFSQGDPLRIAEQREEYDTKPQAKVILVPDRVRDKFPLLETDGRAMCLTSRACGDENPEAFVDIINRRMAAQFPHLA